MNLIPLTQLMLGDDELQHICAVLESGYVVSGPRVQAFESRLSTFLGIQDAVACNSGTSAIQLALMALDIGSGDEVVVPDFCYPSVASAVLHTGADVVLCDIDPGTYNMDFSSLQRALSIRTKAVLAVHQFGLPCGATAIADVADCQVIEDAACALGAQGKDGPCGTQTVAGCFSFHPRKILTTAEGGLVTSHNPELLERCRWLRSHGVRSVQGRGQFEELGLAARMTDVHAAIGLAQMDRLDEMIAGRARSAAMYQQQLAALASVELHPSLWVPERVYQSMVVNLSPEFERDGVVASLREKGIESTIGSYAIHQQKPFGSCRIASGGLPGSVAAASASITLPLWPDMEESVVSRVVDTLKKVTQ
jgi:dTDP-4-amino-4,6-dideoxygalactose transaminase